MKQIVNIEAVKLAYAVLEEFNKLNLYDVNLYENGVQIPITNKILDSWRFVGMSNSSFVETEFWKSPSLVEVDAILKDS